jgi:signal transduction histidine kinase
MFSETLESGMVSDINKQKEFFGIIKRESDRLSNLINHILDFSKIENRKKEFNYEAANITEVVNNIIDLYRLQIDAEGFEFEVNIPEKDIILNIDKDSVYQAILNLLNNAVKYSTDKKHILVEMYETGNFISISITDHGIGIPKKELKNIFNNFYRISATKPIQINGTGLGLTIAKYIIEAHKGTISVESEINIGSRFTIKLPIKT